jgi:hypothetical protein
MLGHGNGVGMGFFSLMLVKAINTQIWYEHVSKATKKLDCIYTTAHAGTEKDPSSEHEKRQT